MSPDAGSSRPRRSERGWKAFQFCLVVFGLALLFELIGLLSSSPCRYPGNPTSIALLGAATLSLFAGGITSLLIAHTRPRTTYRDTARSLGIGAIVLGVISVPVNGVMIALSGALGCG
jgi:hypothetical protein